MPNFYSANFNAVAATVQVDFFELIGTASKILEVHEVRLSQHTDYGDAAEEIVQVLVRRGVGSTTGTGGTQAAVPTKLETGLPTAGFTFDYMNTTKMTAGTRDILLSTAWNIRGEFLYLPTPECRIILAPSERFTVELATTPIDSITFNGSMVVAEIG